MREILLAVGEDPDRDGLKETPKRVAKMYQELFAGLNQCSSEHLKTVFDEDYDEIVLLRDIPFYSMCEHHLLPFFGKAHVAGENPAAKALMASSCSVLVTSSVRGVFRKDVRARNEVMTLIRTPRDFS